MSRPLFEVGEEVIHVDEGDTQIISMNFLLRGERYSGYENIGRASDTGWFYQTTHHICMEQFLRKKYKGAGDFEELMESLKEGKGVEA